MAVPSDKIHSISNISLVVLKQDENDCCFTAEVFVDGACVWRWYMTEDTEFYRTEALLEYFRHRIDSVC